MKEHPFNQRSKTFYIHKSYWLSNKDWDCTVRGPMGNNIDMCAAKAEWDNRKKK